VNDTAKPEVVTTVGGHVDEASVTLAIYGETLDPDRVTALLRCQPTSAHRKGDRKREGSVPYRTGAWLLSEQAKPPTTVDDLIDRLLSRLPAEADVWHRVATEFDLQLRFGIFVSEWNRGFGVSNHSLQRVATLGASILFDIYADQLGSDL
jgi:hypothetical protein